MLYFGWFVNVEDVLNRNVLTGGGCKYFQKKTSLTFLVQFLPRPSNEPKCQRGTLSIQIMAAVGILSFLFLNLYGPMLYVYSLGKKEKQLI